MYVSQAEYLPALVFPFTLLFGSDELSALELSMSILMWWGHSWHATHPSPPVHITDTFDALLKFYDSKLHAHMRRLETAPGLVCWTMLSTLFTEVLSRVQWLRLMDSLFCYFEKPQLVMLVPIVLLKELKGTIMAADTSSQIMLFCRTQQRVNMTSMMKTLFQYLRNTPVKYFSSMVSAFSSRDKLHLGLNQVIEDNHLTEVDEARENLALSTGKPMFPLPKGILHTSQLVSCCRSINHHQMSSSDTVAPSTIIICHRLTPIISILSLIRTVPYLRRLSDQSDEPAD